MKPSNAGLWKLVPVLCLAALLATCGGTPAPEAGTASPPPASEPSDAPATATETASAAEAATATPTPTPTAGPVAAPPTPTPAVESACQGLGGTLEVKVLVGPAEAVGLEPVAVGEVPFAVTTQQPPYLVQGQAPITYEAVLEEEWGTYTVNMDLDMAVSGECTGEADNELLDLVLDMSGEQFVEVNAEGSHGEYPWSGTQTRDLSFPLEEGATAEGEGWVVVLHLGGP
jgi:hypothetical protein